MRTWKKGVLGLVASAIVFSSGFVFAIRVVADELPDTTRCAAEGGCQWVSGKELEEFAKALLKAGGSHHPRDDGTST